MRSPSTLGMRAAGLLLAVIGLGPLLWSGVANAQLRQPVLVDPLLLIAACALVASIAPEKVLAALGTIRRWVLGPSDRTFSIAVFVWIAVFGSALAWYCFGGHAVVTDEYTQGFHGHILLSGRLAAVGETYREFFETAQTVRVGDRWFSEYPIGGPVLAAVGDAIRLPWLINPLIAGFAALALYRFARGAYGIATARLSTILFALSPFVLFMSGSRMTHVATLAAALVAMAALTVWAESDDERTRHWAAAGIGLGIGVMVAFRPYDAVLVAVPIGVFQLVAIHRSRALLRSLSTQVVVALTLVAIQLGVNWRTTGRPLEFAYDALHGAPHRPGFHIDPELYPFTPQQGTRFTSAYLMHLDTVLFESLIPGLAFVVAAMLVLRPVSRWDWLLVGLMGTTIAGYWAYWFPGRFLGPRFLFLAVPAFIVLTARFVAAWWRQGEAHGRVRATMLAVLPVSIAVAWLPIGIHSRPVGVWLRAVANIDYAATPGLDVNGELRDAGIKHALVFVREPLHRRLTARLRLLGLPPYAAERFASDLDACALLQALDVADAMQASPVSRRLAFVFTRARSVGMVQPLPGMADEQRLSLVGGAPSNPACAAEIDGDRRGVIAYDPFLARAEFDASGRLGGNVVFARDLGARDTLLRGRFADRTWYRYHRADPVAGTPAVFVPFR